MPEGNSGRIKGVFNEARSRFRTVDSKWRYATTAALLLLSLTGVTLSPPGQDDPKPGCIGTENRATHEVLVTEWYQRNNTATPVPSATPVQ